MENTIELNEINEVGLGDDTLAADPTHGSGVAASSQCTPDEPVVVESESESGDGDGDGDGAGSVSGSGAGAGVRGEGGAAAFQKKERKKTSKVWNDFSSITVAGVRKNQCHWCKGLFAVGKSSTTSTLSRHLTGCKKFVELNNRKKQKTLCFEPSDDHEGFGIVSNFVYNEKRVRELAAHMVLLHEYPFNMMEHELFNKFMRACTPHWKKISRATVKSDCIATYNIEKIKLKTLLSGIDRVNITTDMWTSSQRVSYMVVTCHFVDCNWQLQKRILNFCNVPPPHSGVVIADALRDTFNDWGIMRKVFTITVDNASANGSAIEILRDDFRLKGILLPVGGLLFHVRCCAHITNLLVQAGLSEIGDIIDSVRQGIKYIVASERRLKVFSEIARGLDLGCKKLILDVPTRWNSTYLMLETAIKFREVFPRYHRVEQAFLWVVSPEEWEKVENVNQVLAVFNDVTNIVSGSDYPTSNLFLPEVWRMKEIVDIKAGDRNEYMKLMAARMSDKFDKYWGETNMLMALAAVLDPRYKMKLISFCFPIIYPLDVKGNGIKGVLRVLQELYEVYVAAHNSSILQQQAAAEGGSSSLVTSVTEGVSGGGRSRFRQHCRSSDIIRPLKTDLDIYLEEDVFISESENGDDSDANFDALEWWKSNALKYRILSKMARDLLAVPISTVASESSFSAGGRVIEPHRASLSTDTVQMLLCGSDWVRALHGIKKKSRMPVSYDYVIHLVSKLFFNCNFTLLILGLCL
jgi:hypothetical protein